MLADFKSVSLVHEDFTSNSKLFNVEKIFEDIVKNNLQQEILLILLSNIKSTEGGSLYFSLPIITKSLYKKMNRIWNIVKPNWPTKDFYLEISNLQVFFVMIELTLKLSEEELANIIQIFDSENFNDIRIILNRIGLNCEPTEANTEKAVRSFFHSIIEIRDIFNTKLYLFIQSRRLLRTMKIGTAEMKKAINKDFKFSDKQISQYENYNSNFIETFLKFLTIDTSKISPTFQRLGLFQQENTMDIVTLLNEKEFCSEIF